MPERAEGLPLDIIRSRARIYVAARGEVGTNLYIHDAIYREGEVIQPERVDAVIPRDSVIVFADDAPLKNWGHACRYLLHDPESGELTGVIQALLPPTLDFGEQFVAFHTPVRHPPPSVIEQWPILTLPEWVFFDSADRWHAILYAGASMNRHVNDIEFLYRTLVHTYLVPRENITVLSYDGTLAYNNANWERYTGVIEPWPGNNTPYQITIDGPGTRAELLAAIAAAGERLGPNDNLLLHTNNHGNRVADTASTIISYEAPDITERDLEDAVAALPAFNCLMVMMEQCYSGGFIQPIMNASPARCTSVAAAVDATTSSDGGPYFDPFALAWINAIAGAYPDGSALSPSPSTNPRGVVTAQDAFDYALKTDTGPDDDPQFQSNACGATTTLASDRPFIPIPIPWRYPLPWDILPDPSPEQIAELVLALAPELESGRLASQPSAVLDSLGSEIARVVRERAQALDGPGGP
jgi:hypothetical protein